MAEDQTATTATTETLSTTTHNSKTPSASQHHRRRLKAKPPLRIQYMSDLHLDFRDQYRSFSGAFPRTAPYLLLDGDVGRLGGEWYERYRDFVAAQTRRYRRVFLVLGNHEVHGLGWDGVGKGAAAGGDALDEALGLARKLEGEEVMGGRLTVLQRDRWEFDDDDDDDDEGGEDGDYSDDVPGAGDPNEQQARDNDERETGPPPPPPARVILLGCTLWTRIPDSARDAVRGKVKDYRNIGGWTVYRHVEAHEGDLAWLKDEVRRIRRKEEEEEEAEERERQQQREEKGQECKSRQARREVIIIIATHHAPMDEGTSRPGDAANPWRSAFSSDAMDRDGFDWAGGNCSNGGNGDGDEDGDGGQQTTTTTTTTTTRAKVTHWVFGHTHYTNDFVRPGDGIRVVSNQRGYVLPGRTRRDGDQETEERHMFDPERVLEIAR